MNPSDRPHVDSGPAVVPRLAVAVMPLALQCTVSAVTAVTAVSTVSGAVGTESGSSPDRWGHRHGHAPRRPSIPPRIPSVVPVPPV